METIVKIVYCPLGFTAFSAPATSYRLERAPYVTIGRARSNIISELVNQVTGASGQILVRSYCPEITVVIIT